MTSDRPPSIDPKELPLAPAAERNKDAILRVLKTILPERGTLVEIASGFGQHAVHFARHLSGWQILPTDVAEDHVAVIRARCARAGVTNILVPRCIDAEHPPWPVIGADAVIATNLMHIAPWSVTEGLFRGAKALLAANGALLTYGPYRIHGEHNSAANAAFDKRLRSIDPRYGLRDLEKVVELASTHGFEEQRPIPMPANNFVLHFRRRPLA